MLAQGDRVICIEADWNAMNPDGMNWLSRALTRLVLTLAGPCPLVEGREYSVYHIQPGGAVFSQNGRSVTLEETMIGVGLPSPVFRLIARLTGVPLPTHDLWPESWFRKAERRATGVAEAIEAFRDMARRGSVPEAVDA